MGPRGSHQTLLPPVPATFSGRSMQKIPSNLTVAVSPDFPQTTAKAPAIGSNSPRFAVTKLRHFCSNFPDILKTWPATASFGKTGVTKGNGNELSLGVALVWGGGLANSAVSGDFFANCCVPCAPLFALWCAYGDCHNSPQRLPNNQSFLGRLTWFVFFQGASWPSACQVALQHCCPEFWGGRGFRGSPGIFNTPTSRGESSGKDSARPFLSPRRMGSTRSSPRLGKKKKGPCHTFCNSVITLIGHDGEGSQNDFSK